MCTFLVCVFKFIEMVGLFNGSLLLQKDLRRLASLLAAETEL